MARCEYLDRCRFFNKRIAAFHACVGRLTAESTDRLRSLCATSRLDFCLLDCARCARHVVAEALGEEDVPDELHPDEVLRARSIIARKRAQLVAIP